METDRTELKFQGFCDMQPFGQTINHYDYFGNSFEF